MERHKDAMNFGTVFDRRVPFHAFEYGGRCFVYHFALGECVAVSKGAYECLSGWDGSGVQIW